MNRVILYNKSYEAKVRLLCDQYNIQFPADNSFLFLSVDEHTNVSGIIGMKKVYFVEPMIAATPQIAYDLGKMVEGIIVGEQIKKVRCVVPKTNQKHIEQLKKVGYEIINSETETMEKCYG